jgi:hypothetical protein
VDPSRQVDWDVPSISFFHQMSKSLREEEAAQKL